MFSAIEVAYLIYFMIVLGVPAFGATTDESPSSQVSALCIQHIGISDKPIFPLIIAVDEEAVQSCKRLIGEENQHSAIYTVTREQVTLMRARTRHLLVTAKKPIHEREYGTFKVAIFTGNGPEQFILNRDGTLNFVEILSKLSRNSELSETLRSIEKRLRNQELTGGTL